MPAPLADAIAFLQERSLSEQPSATIPLHDPFRRVFILLCPAAFERCFMRWAQAIARLMSAGGGERVSLAQEEA
ncbi:MAG: hypothetical protein NZM18_07100 [Thermoflexales bacterium]|nr:hypothetical protein [Thermoflexales bacterium]MDW8351741.1 hypothetical protein [Anaerolineae bacterium]